MFEDYSAQVLAAYRDKKISGTLSPNLNHPTPAGLKTECALVLSERGLEEDETILRLFFGSKENSTAYMLAIRNCEADKFRPLCNFLRENADSTGVKNIELLAWLIDFKPRPYTYRQPKLSRIQEDTLNITIAGPEKKQDEIITGGDLTEIPVARQDETREIQPPASQKDQLRNEKKGIYPKSLSIRKPGNAAIAFLILAIIAGGAYFISTNTGPGKCMYWTGDHYQPGSCDLRVNDTQVLALDTMRVAHFKKITRPDTLTGNSVGKVYYFKLNNNFEFYTAGGTHPVYSNRRLKPLTDYILNKYIPRNPVVASN